MGYISALGVVPLDVFQNKKLRVVIPGNTDNLKIAELQVVVNQLVMGSAADATLDETEAGIGKRAMAKSLISQGVVPLPITGVLDPRTNVAIATAGLIGFVTTSGRTVFDITQEMDSVVTSHEYDGKFQALPVLAPGPLLPTGTPPIPGGKGPTVRAPGNCFGEGDSLFCLPSTTTLIIGGVVVALLFAAYRSSK